MQTNQNILINVTDLCYYLLINKCFHASYKTIQFLIIISFAILPYGVQVCAYFTYIYNFINNCSGNETVAKQISLSCNKTTTHIVPSCDITLTPPTTI